MDIQKINLFLSVETVMNNGYGGGGGDGYGGGYGEGGGGGYGDGDGGGYGDGGYGDGDGGGYGGGDGYGGGGYGDGDGYCGDGYGGGIKSINGNLIYTIDAIDTIIISIKNNIAKGFIIQSDLSLLPCYIAKGENQFAHGDTIHEAVKSLQEKLLITLPIEQRIIKFKEQFKSLKKKYKAKDYFDWHYFLTGSCNMGKMSFINQNSINLDKDSFTILEFIEKTKNQYGSDVIKQLKDSYK